MAQHLLPVSSTTAVSKLLLLPHHGHILALYEQLIEHDLWMSQFGTLD